jgi:hypothetical protein
VLSGSVPARIAAGDERVLCIQKPALSQLRATVRKVLG